MPSIRRFIRFALSGCSGVVVHLSLLYILQELFLFALIPSCVIAIEMAIINNFFWNEWWTFQDLAQKRKGATEIFKRFLRFNTVCFFGLIFNTLLTNSLHAIVNLDIYVSSLIAIVAVIFWNYWLNLKFSWKVSDTVEESIARGY